MCLVCRGAASLRDIVIMDGFRLIVVRRQMTIFEYWKNVQAIAASLGLRGVIKTFGQDALNEPELFWSPTHSYLETGRLGPISASEIEWIDLATEVTIHRGRLLPPATHDKKELLVSALSDTALVHQMRQHFVRVLPPNFSSKPTPLRGAA